MIDQHVHSAHCECAHHHAPKSTLAALLPALSCALCPACLSLWKPLLGLLGVATLVTESQHAWLLAFALLISLGFGLREAVKLREWRPFVPTLLGSLLMAVGHGAESHTLEWLGTATMFLSIPTRVWLRTARSAA